MNSLPPANPGEFAPTASWENLRRRAELLRRLRDFFHRHDFLEVETPLLSAETVVDRHLDPLSVTLFHDPCIREAGPTFWLQTSPELSMKRLLASGAPAIYQVTRAFRGGEQGPLHNPEFTIVEWYCASDGYDGGMQFLSDLCDAMLGLGAAQRVSYRAAFLEHTGIDPLEDSVEGLAAALTAGGVAIPSGFSEGDRDDWLDLAMSEIVQPKLGQTCPTVLYDYPASQAALARLCDDDPRVARRFELFVGGVELANGYHELADADELRRRSARVNRLRVGEGKIELPGDGRFIDAMESGLPDCTGVALGFDRLAMVALNAKSIDDVMAFPINRA